MGRPQRFPRFAPPSRTGSSNRQQARGFVVAKHDAPLAQSVLLHSLPVSRCSVLRAYESLTPRIQKPVDFADQLEEFFGVLFHGSLGAQGYPSLGMRCALFWCRRSVGQKGIILAGVNGGEAPDVFSSVKIRGFSGHAIWMLRELARLSRRFRTQAAQKLSWNSSSFLGAP